MEEFGATVKQITKAIDNVIPPELPVPEPITVLAEIIGERISQLPFRYRYRYLELDDVTMWEAIIVILLQPLIWNCLGRLEYKTRVLSKIFFKPQYGVYALALWIFVAGLYRDGLFVIAMEAQQTSALFRAPQMQAVGGICVMTGTVLVLSSFYRLGFKGTYLGDYFGFLLDEKVTAFPFNILSDPMYVGSTLTFLGKAILERSPTGILLSAWVYIVYRIAGVFEGSFTQHIYAQKEAEKKKQ